MSYCYNGSKFNICRQLSHEIEVSPKGARLGVVDGNSGMMLISPNFTDNSAILACRILSIPTRMSLQIQKT